MRPKVMSATAILCATLLIGSSLAQQLEPTVVFQSQTREVLLEVVVRDAHGKLVTKIDPSQISIYEDGVRQDIKSFRLVPGKEVRAELERETALAATKPDALHFDAATRPPSNPLRTINIVCLILNDIGSGTRGFAFDAAKKFVNNELRPDTFIGVFSLDATGLRPVFPFSNNRERLLKAVELAATHQLPAMNQSSAAMLNGLSMSTIGVFPGSTGNIGTSGPPVGSLPAGSPAGGPASFSDGSARGDMEDKIIRGLRELDALIGLIKQLNQLPFQKTVLLMSTGLTRPPDQLEYWQSLITLANNGGVTFYGLDVHGLDPSYNAMDEAKARLQAVATMSQTQSTGGLPPRGPTTPGGSSTLGPSAAQQMMASMHQTDYLTYAVLTANSQEALRELSESTGGFVIANTNNIEPLLAKVMEDVDTHYELAYRPASPSSDGHFRKIEVKLSRPDLRVETRTGYFAVPETGEGPLVAGDFGALQALDTKPQPHAFDFNSKAFRFRPASGKSQYAIAFEVPIANLTATPENNKHRYHAYLLALVKNAQGDIVERVSKDVPSEVSDTSLPALRADAMTYEHAINLAPGHYTIETAVVDQEGNRASTNIFELDNREHSGPGVSDITLVRRVHDLDRPPDPSDPFETPGKRAQPYVSTTLPAGALPYIYFVAYPAENQPATLKAQFLKNGKILTTQKSPLPQADASGVPMTLQPVAFPGDYEVRITIEQGPLSIERSIKYTIAK
jgi:VWFA-related protein